MRNFIFVLIFLSLAAIANADETFFDLCTRKYLKDSVCPTDVCQLTCMDGSQKKECPLVCVPLPCAKISTTNCPKQFCEIMTDCAKQKVCQPKMAEANIPACGGLAFNGQSVECCSGLVKRCGFDYLDGTCNMEGKNTAYNLPICIPCGDGVCSNFENHCNCPEDCHKDIIPL